MDNGDIPKSIEKAISLLGIGVVVLEDDEIRFANEAFARLLGYDADELAKIDPYALVHEAQRAEAEQTRGQPIDSSGPTRYTTLRKDGDTVEVEVSSVVLPEGRTLVLVRNVTSEQQAEREARRVHKMEAIGQLAAGIAHDFNNYLTVVRLLTESLKATPQNLQTDLEELEKLTENAARLTNQLLTFGGRDPRRPTVLDINISVFEMLSMLQRLTGERVAVTPNLEPGLPPVQLDEGQLQQLVVNLVVNAAWAVQDGGRVSVETASVPGRDDMVALFVRDDGVGMTAEVLERATEPMFSTHPDSGAGMGLAIVYGIVHQSGGSLEIDSSPGAGTTVKIMLPTAAAPYRRTPTPHPFDAGEEQTSLLLVEDERMIRERLVPGLEARGFNVQSVADGNAAIELIASDAKFDVLVADIRLPGATGMEVAHALLERHPDAAIVFVSGYPTEFDEGFSDAQVTFLRKPFSASDLAASIEELRDAAD